MNTTRSLKVTLIDGPLKNIFGKTKIEESSNDRINTSDFELGNTIIGAKNREKN